MVDAMRVGTEFLINTQTDSNQLRPSIAELENGGFVITWQDSSGSLGDSDGFSVKAQVFNSNGIKQGSEFLGGVDKLVDARLGG